jgi:Carboxypeptidase regulatory-like domain
MLSLHAALGAGLPGSIVAQGAVPRQVHVTVAGSDGAPLDATTLFIVKQGVGAMLTGNTDAKGHFTFLVPRDSGRYSLLARKIGFAPVQTILFGDNRDTVTISLRLTPLPPNELPRVRVEASARGKNYYLDSAEIASTKGRTIRDAYDALRKLRPDMLGDKGRCPSEPVDNVWVNGRRVLWMAAFASAAQRGVMGSGRVHVVRGARKATPEPDLVDSVLVAIRAEDIAEIRYVNCWDTSMPGLGTNNAVYIVLKPGLDWDWKQGSHPADSSASVLVPRKPL